MTIEAIENTTQYLSFHLADEVFALDISKNYRLVFEPNHKPLPKNKDGGLDLTRITSIKILRVEDYH